MDTQDPTDFSTLDPETLVSTRKGAPLIGYEESTIATKRSRYPDSLPPHYKIGGRVLYRVADILEWRERFRVERTA